MSYQISLILNIVFIVILVLICINKICKGNFKILKNIKSIIVSDDYNIIVYIFKKVVYILVVLLLLCYLYNDWINIKNINLYKELSPKIILLIFVLIMLVLPFIKTFEILGLKLDMKEKELVKGTEKAVNDAIFKLKQEKITKVTMDDLNKLEKEKEE